LAVNDPDWLRRGTILWVNARWLPPPAPVADHKSPRVGLVGTEIAYVVLPQPGACEMTPAAVSGWLEEGMDTRPRVDAGGAMAGHLWDLVEHNPLALSEDLVWFRAQRSPGVQAKVAVLGPEEGLVVDAGATVEPFVVADTRNGPVLIDRGAVV